MKIFSGLSVAVKDFYLEAERKTTAIKDVAFFYIVRWYGTFVTVPFVYTIIIKMIIEKCESEPETWFVAVKARYAERPKRQVIRSE